MRNFKKFLALVLAMLMVSACAVSVSAFDDVAGNTYASSIELLAELGVISGRGDGKFYPNDTLTREEAAVIAAKLLAGANAPEWADTTTAFVDVEDAWSFAYINYAAKYKAMEGVGDNKFEPKRELQIDEAIKIALAVADPDAYREARVLMTTEPTGYWADHFIIAANKVGVVEGGPEAGLTNGIATIRDYEAPCTRGMFAQIMANAFNFGEGIKEGFGYNSFKATVDAVTENDKKYVDIYNGAIKMLRVTDEFFTAALVAEGYTDITAADLEAGIDTKPCYLNIVYLTETKEITSIEVLTSIDVVKYDANLIKVVKDADDKLVTSKIEIDGVQYIVNRADGTEPSGAWGEGSSTVRGIYVAVDNVNVTAMAADTIPDFYEAFLYDDNGDGDYERAAIKEYYAGILVDAGVDKDDIDGDKNKTEQLTTIKKYGKNADLAVDTELGAGNVNTTFTGETASYGNTPVLYRVDGDNVDILEVAKTDVKGEVTNFSVDNKYINIGEIKVEFAKAYLNPDKWVLGQNVALYTIGGKYVDVVNEDVTTGMKVQKILVDNVTVKDGVALIDGYMWNNGILTAVEDYEVVGIVSNNKLISKTYSALKIAGSGNTYYAGLVGDGTPNDAGTDWKADTKTVEFEDGKSYTFHVTNVGAYYADRYTDGDISRLQRQDGKTSKNVEIKGGYFYIDGEAYYKMAASYTVLTNTTDAKANDAYAKVTYKTLDSFKYEDTAVKAWDKNLDAAERKNTDLPVVFVYAATANNTPVAGEQKKLNEGESIVKIYAVENESLAESTYLAQDIFTGEKYEVTGNVADGYDYVVVKDGKIVDTKPLWIYDGEENDVFDVMSVDVTVKFDGKTVKGYNTEIVDPVDENAPKYLGDINTKDEHYVTFTDIKYWVDNTDTTSVAGDFKAGDQSTIFTADGTYTFTGCIINGTVVILDTPVLVPAPIN